MTEKQRREKAFAEMGKIYHELAPGVYTYHICPHCGERAARSEKCYVCLMKGIVE